jgi:hypothetical protein
MTTPQIGRFICCPTDYRAISPPHHVSSRSHPYELGAFDSRTGRTICLSSSKIHTPSKISRWLIALEALLRLYSRRRRNSRSYCGRPADRGWEKYELHTTICIECTDGAGSNRFGSREWASWYVYERITIFSAYLLILLPKAETSLIDQVFGGFSGMGAGFLYNIVSVPQENLRNRTFPVLAGNIVGGSSAVNAMMTVRGTSEDYDRWGNFFSDTSAWSWHGLLPYFRKV